MSNNSCCGFIVSSKDEQLRLQLLRPGAQVLVLPFPLFAPDPARYIGGKSKSKENQIPISDMSPRSFEFKYREQLDEFLTGCDSCIALAPFNQDGKQWLAHAYHMGKLFIEPDVPLDCGLYVYLGDSAITPKSLVSPDPAVLDTEFHKYVFGYITAAWFRSYVLAPFHQKVAHIGKGALSLGGCYTLLALAAIENKYHVGIAAAVNGTSVQARATLPLQFYSSRTNKTITTAPIIPAITSGKAVDDTDSAKSSNTPILPSALEFHDASVEDYAEAWCVMQEQPNTWLKHVHSGTVAIVTDDPLFASQLREAVHDTRALLASYGLKLHETEGLQLSYINALACGNAHFPLVVSGSEGDDSDLLMSHLREQMFRAYFTLDPARCAHSTYFDLLDSSSNVQCRGSAIAINTPDNVNDYLALLGTYGFILTKDADTAAQEITSISYTIEHDPSWLNTLLQTLSSFGIRPSYALYLLHSLQRRKMLVHVNQRFELSSYGYAYAMSLMQFMSLSKVADAWPELHAQFTSDIERSSDRKRTLDSALSKALDLLQPARAAAGKFELPRKRIKKTGSDKKVTWTLHLDNKEHVAYWTTRSGKRRPVWYKVVGHTDSTPCMIDTNIDIFPREKKHLVLLPRCCYSCGCNTAKISTDYKKNTGTLTVTCTACGEVATYTSVPIIKEF